VKEHINNVIVTSVDSDTYTTSTSNTDKNIYYHLVKWDDWVKRIKTHLNIASEPCKDSECDFRKFADFKPMMGMLFQDLFPSDRYGYWAIGDYDGFFGSFNQLLDMKKLYHYDVISGISKPVPDNIKLLRGNNAEVKRIDPTRVTGAFTIHRNNQKINRLFLRSQDWKTIVTDMKKYYGFDDTSIIYDLRENYASVLAQSHDVRQCCFSNRTKTVWKSVDSYDKFSTNYPSNALISNRPIVIVEMYDVYAINPAYKVNLIWKRSLGLEVSISVNSTYVEYARPLFFHFLQWKYCCGNELKNALQKFQTKLASQGLTFYTVSCIQLAVQYFKAFEFSMC